MRKTNRTQKKSLTLDTTTVRKLDTTELESIVGGGGASGGRVRCPTTVSDTAAAQ